jgi:hypothetical protein
MRRPKTHFALIPVEIVKKRVTNISRAQPQEINPRDITAPAANTKKKTKSATREKNSRNGKGNLK